VYTTGSTENLPLDEILYRIQTKYADQLPVSGKSHPEDLKDFLGSVVPEFDRERVYPSDIKKIVTWFNILSKELPEILVKKEEEVAEEPKAEITEKEAKPAAKKSVKPSKSTDSSEVTEKAPKAVKTKKAKES
jgi:hypothetical protein